MTRTTLLVGATGYLGRYVALELHTRGHRVRAMVRDRARAEEPGPSGAPSLRGLVDEWVVGDVTSPGEVVDVAKGVDHVISTLGVTTQKADPWDVDLRGNRGVLDSALRHGVQSFCYVNVLGGDRCPAELTRAKTAFAAELSASTVSSQVVNPPGYFSDVAEVLAMAQRGRVFLLDPDARINPIHGADLAGFCVDRVTDGTSGSWDIGGPEIFTWREIAELAFEAVGRPVRVTTIPPVLARGAIAAIRPFNHRAADTMGFVAWGLVTDCVGERVGSRRLGDFFGRASGPES